MFTATPVQGDIVDSFNAAPTSHLFLMHGILGEHDFILCCGLSES